MVIPNVKSMLILFIVGWLIFSNYSSINVSNTISQPSNVLEGDNHQQYAGSEQIHLKQYSSIGLDTVYNNTNQLRIFGDTQLADYAVSGDGSLGTPYILENYNVTSDGVNEALYLSGITAHTIVRNNIFDHQNNGNEAVFIYNSKNIILENNIIKNSKVGIYFSLGSDNIVRDQTFVSIAGLSSYSIQLYRTQNITIEDLKINNKAGIAINIADANSTVIKNTVITGDNDGIQITRSGSGYGQDNLIRNVTIDTMSSEGIIDWGFHNTIANCSFTSTQTGITLFQSTNTIIENNTFIDMSQAIQFSTSSTKTSDHIIRFNTIENSTRGFYALNAYIQNTLIANNTLFNNTYGIDWDTTSAAKDNIIQYNILSNNSYGMDFGDYNGMNATVNYILNSKSIGVEVLGSETLWVKNNTIYGSNSYGLLVTSQSVITGSQVMYNDFISNGGSNSQVIVYTGGHQIEMNYYSDHTNIDTNKDGFADSSYAFDNSGTYYDPTPLSNFTTPFSQSYALPPIILSTNSSTVHTDVGSSGYTLSWKLFDKNPDTYSITVDGSPLPGHTNQVWTSGQAITISIDGLSVGTHTYQATFVDTWSNEISNTVTVIVHDYDSPTLSYNIVDFATYNYGELSTFTWIGQDAEPSNYSLWIDDILQIDHASWISGMEYDFNISGLEVALHRITLELLDVSGNSRRSYIYFYIVDGDAPVIQEHPSNTLQIPYPSQNYFVTYIVTDNVNASHYQIWINEKQQGADMPWINATDISINLIPYLTTKGVYNFTIVFFDQSGFYTSHHIEITYDDGVSTDTNTTTTPTGSKTTDTQTPSGETPVNSPIDKAGFLPNLLFVPSFSLLLTTAIVHRRKKNRYIEE